MRFPQHHLADSTVARILTAAKAVKSGRVPTVPGASSGEPGGRQSGDKLPPPGLVKVAEGGRQAAPGAAQAAAQGAPTGGDLPPLDESGLDLGMVLQGRDSIDALLGG